MDPIADHQQAEGAARTHLSRIPGFTWTPFDRDDLPEIADFYATVESFDRNPERSSLADLQDFWDSPRSVPEEDTLVARDESGRVVATAWSGCNRSVTDVREVFLGGAVHPSLRGRGIGRLVLDWEMAHGRAWHQTTRQDGFGPLRMRLLAPVDQDDIRDLATRAGLAVARYYFEMERSLTDIPNRSCPAGILITPWDPDLSDETRQVRNQAFRDHWGHTDASPQMWADRLAATAFRPEWSLLARDADTLAVVGVAMNCAYEQDWSDDHREGYTDELGVLRNYRGRGVAKALLIESMHRFQEARMDAATLGVDTQNPSGAVGLYQGLGYRRTASTCIHELQE